MKEKTNSNIPIILLCTGLVFLLLFLTMVIGNWVIIMGIRAGLFSGHPDTPLIPFLIQTGMVSIFIGVILTLALCRIPLRPIRELIQAIHAVADGNFQTKIHFKYLKGFRELSENFNRMTSELSGIEMLRSDFIHNFSHEFKTPSMSISGFAKLMKKENTGEKEREEYLDIIIAECARLSELSSNILNLSRVDSISVLTETVQFNVSEQIRESILQLQQKWEAKKITFRIQMDDCLIIGNPDLLKQVWMNLIDNAIKFSFPEGEICIHAAETHNGFLFRIRDNGIGMSSLTQEKIFNRFYQGDPSHSVEGNGLGLPLVRRILELHRGTVRVGSQPGKGSIFSVTLPGSPVSVSQLTIQR